jgi:hypothetical protein
MHHVNYNPDLETLYVITTVRLVTKPWNRGCTTTIQTLYYTIFPIKKEFIVNPVKKFWNDNPGTEVTPSQVIPLEQWICHYSNLGR